jgi:isocitrate lyase
MAMTPSQLIQLPARDLAADWASNARWAGIQRTYTAADVVRLRGSVQVENTLARLGAERLWRLLHERDFVAALSALTGGQAVKAGLEAIYLSGWQVAADANLAEQVYPDQSLYPANSVPAVARRINNALRRADQIEDQLASEKKCGHLGGKVLVPTGQFVRTLTAARLAADVGDVPTLLVARTDALDATLLTSDVDERDQEFLTGERTAEGYFRVRNGLEAVVARCRAYAPTPTCCGSRPPNPTWGRRPASRRRSMRSFPASCWPTTARRRSTGSVTWTTTRSPSSRASWPPWATASSSSPRPASMP